MEKTQKCGGHQESVVDEVLLIDPQDPRLCQYVLKTTETMWTFCQSSRRQTEDEDRPTQTTIVLDRILIKAGPTLSSSHWARLSAGSAPSLTLTANLAPRRPLIHLIPSLVPHHILDNPNATVSPSLSRLPAPAQPSAPSPASPVRPAPSSPHPKL